MLRIDLNTKQLSSLQTQALLQDPTDKLEAIEGGRKQYDEIQKSSQNIAEDMIKTNPELNKEILVNNIRDFGVEHTRMPDATEQKIIEMQTGLVASKIEILASRLDKLFDSKLINNEFIKEHKSEIASYMLRQDPLADVSPSKELIKNIENTMRENIKENVRELELQKDLSRDMGMSL